jgi:serine/threonine protein kinase
MIQPGVVLKGQYRIDALIGGGGMALVYRAYDTNLQRVCAIKQNVDTSPEAQRQFHLEAILLAGLSHPHLARVTDHFVDTSGQQYLVMDFVEGENLESYVARNGPAPEAKTLAWMAGVLDAVAYCHSQGVIHRDIKPSNLVKCSGQDRVVLVDFGIAKQQAGGMTLTGARAATPAYAPLEQFTGHTDARTDVYALGATLYFLLSGVEPPDSRLVASGVESVAPLRTLNPQVSARTEQAVQRAMALRVADRPQNVAGLMTALAGRQPPGPPPAPRPTRSGRRRASSAVLAALALLGVLAVMLLVINQLNGGVGDGTATPAVVAMASPPDVATEPDAPAAAVEATATGESATPVDTSAAPASTMTPAPTIGRPPTSTPASTPTPISPPTSTPRPTQPPVVQPPAPPTNPPASWLAPTLMSPGNGTEQRDNVLLQWSFGRPLRPGELYRVTIRTDRNQTPRELLITDITAESYQVRFDQYPGFFHEDNTTYFWSVIVISQAGNPASPSSAESSFVLRRGQSPAPATDAPPAEQPTNTPTWEQPTNTPTPEQPTNTPTSEQPTNTPTSRGD